MNLSTYNFPKITPTDIAFSTLRTDPKLLEEAKARGFYDGNTPYNALFNEIFYHGGKLNLKQPTNGKMLNYFKAFISSYEPRHEEKEAICALLLSELVEKLK